MEYNSTRKKLAMPEYGRNVQKMILYAMSIEDREHRLKVANVIVNIMAQMHPKLRETADYKHKLWDHLHIISGWQLDVDGPYPPPSRDVLESRPKQVPYSDGRIKYRPYGKNIEAVIEKAIEYEEGPEKEAFMKAIANHLKKSYLNWNRDSVNDDLIFEHFADLSDGKLNIEGEFKLNETSDILARGKKKKFSGKPRDNNYGKGKKKYKN
ncbi:MAG: DUF4290 domain-containing protein [Bacteroidales bacterium]|jgi:hypothetical protein|nr:DUF4290 domain-containing protein [Bacteroidales bacterium]